MLTLSQRMLSLGSLTIQLGKMWSIYVVTVRSLGNQTLYRKADVLLIDPTTESYYPKFLAKVGLGVSTVGNPEICINATRFGIFSGTLALESFSMVDLDIVFPSHMSAPSLVVWRPDILEPPPHSSAHMSRSSKPLYTSFPSEQAEPSFCFTSPEVSS